MLYAHSLPDQPPEKWQPLSEHPLPSPSIIGYLHDPGKASEEGQKRIASHPKQVRPEHCLRVRRKSLSVTKKNEKRRKKTEKKT